MSSRHETAMPRHRSGAWLNHSPRLLLQRGGCSQRQHLSPPPKQSPRTRNHQAPHSQQCCSEVMQLLQVGTVALRGVKAPHLAGMSTKMMPL